MDVAEPAAGVVVLVLLDAAAILAILYGGFHDDACDACANAVDPEEVVAEAAFVVIM